MTKKLEIYKCGVCGNVVEVYDGGAGDLICCGQPMRLMPERGGNPAEEKHVPFGEIADGRLVVRVGQNEAHPMDRKHYIQWIEVIAGETVWRRQLSPDDPPEASFDIGDRKDLQIREFCNLHGLWVG